jgi:ABC-type transporter Mla maintaining outer membrane lipid asymmetry ATPase subunit MlaF
MSELFRLVEVRGANSDRAYSFTLHSGELKILQLSAKTGKDAMIDRVLGASFEGAGRVEMVRGERRQHKSAGKDSQRERRYKNETLPVVWQSLQTGRAGRVAWVAGNGGLISNLKVWENVTLPLWQFFRHDVTEAEQRVVRWLGVLGLAQDAFAEFMAAPPSSLELWQCKLAGLLRALVQQPQVLVVDAQVFDDVELHLTGCWQAALAIYAAQGSAILVITDKETMLPWAKIE